MFEKFWMNLISAFLLVSLIGVEGVGGEIQPGQQPPREIREKIRPLYGKLQKTLANNDERATREVCHRIIEVMGPWGGNPESVPRYYQPIENSEPNREAVWKLWREIERRMRRDALWNRVSDGDPGKMKNGLRFASRPVIAYSIVLQLKTDQKEEYLKLIRKGADYLLKTQREDGLFPFPDLRGDHSLFGPMVTKLLKRNPNALVDGWIVEDLNGDLKYDNGICGVAMIEAFEATHNKKYLESARLASNWARKQPLCMNWNYNAFSIWLLARYARASGDEKYLEAAIEKLKIGVLPGQMKNGRWFDAHNAKLVYHAIIVRAMLEVYLALDDKHEFRKRLRTAIVLSVDNAASQIIKHGASSNSKSSEILCEALLIFGPQKKWKEALNININAGLHVMQDRQAPNIGAYLPHYLRYMENSRKEK